MMQHHIVVLPGLDGLQGPRDAFVRALPVWLVPTVVEYPTNSPADYDELVRRVLACIPPEGSVILVAESFSGPVAVKVAGLIPARLEAVVFVGSFVTRPLPFWIAAIAYPLCAGWILRLLLGRPLRRVLVRLLLLNGVRDRRRIDDVASSLGAVSPTVLAARLRATMRVDVRCAYAELTIPMLYLAARRDRVVGNRGWRMMRSVRPAGLQVHHLDGPHMLLGYEPAAAVETITAFLAAQAATSQS